LNDYCFLLVLSGILACVIIYFDRIFINDLCKCYLGPQLCCAVGSVESFQNDYTARLQNCTQANFINNDIQSLDCQNEPYGKLPLIKAQLACAVGMLISCGVYVVVYLFACFGICFGHD
jgi:hypothetical protein